MRLLARFGRRGWSHQRESCRSPKRIGAAGVGEEGLPEVFLVARRGSSEVEVWCSVEGELEGSFYSRSEAVAVNVISPVRITARQWSDERFRGLGSSGLVH